MIKPCYDKWWEWSCCIECAMCCGENDCKYHDQFTPDEAEAEKDRAVEEVKKRLEPAHDFIHFLSDKYDIAQGYLEASIYRIIMENINPKNNV